MVVIIARAGDEHAAKVRQVLTQQHQEPSFVLDLSRFPVTANVGATFGGELTFQWKDLEAAVDLQSVKSFWWRRPQAFALDPRIESAEARSFAYSECLSAVHGLLSCCGGLWVNDIHADDAADYKPRQLKAAAEAGFNVPDTLITNDPSLVRDFWDRHKGAVVYKPFNQRAIAWRPARRLRPEELVLLPHVKAAPLIFQALVPGTLDIRVTIVGDEVFPAGFEIPENGPVDYRLHLSNAQCQPLVLPEHVLASITALMRALRLEYGAIDLRLDTHGQYKFFELNTGGEFLFVEGRTGQPIAEAMAAHLAQGTPTHSRPGNC